MRLRKALSIILAVCMILSSVSVAYAGEIPEVTEVKIETVSENATGDHAVEVTETAEEAGSAEENSGEEEKAGSAEENSEAEEEAGSAEENSGAEEEAESTEEKTEAGTEENNEGVKEIVLTAELDDVIVTLKADAGAFDNKGELSLKVTPVEIAETEEEALDAVEKENVAKRVTYDITVLDDGEEIEPVKEVKVSFELKDAPSGADGVNIYHHDEEDGIEKIAAEVLKEEAKEETVSVSEEKIETAETEKKEEKTADKTIEVKEVDEEELAATDDVELIDDVTVEATTDSFSLYTVDFTYNEKTISIAGDSTGNKLDDIVSQLGIEEKVEEATTYQDAECTDEVESGEVKEGGKTLFSVYEIGNEWYVDAVNAFDTEHGLVVKTADGAEYKIKVTDESYIVKFAMPKEYINKYELYYIKLIQDSNQKKMTDTTKDITIDQVEYRIYSVNTGTKPAKNTTSFKVFLDVGTLESMYFTPNNIATSQWYSDSDWQFGENVIAVPVDYQKMTAEGYKGLIRFEGTIMYTATFNLNGGVLSDEQMANLQAKSWSYNGESGCWEKSFIQGTSYSTILDEWSNNSPAKSGYTFDKWTPESGTLTADTTFTATYKSSKTSPQVSDFTFTPPQNTVYDKTGKVASVVSDKTGMGAITVFYSTDKEEWTYYPVKNVNSYYVAIDVSEGTLYSSAVKLTCESWKFDITKKQVNVIADNKTSKVGADLITLTYTADDLISGDVFTGELATDADKTKAGTYDITQGTLTAGNNYSINFTKGTYTITDSNPKSSGSSGSSGGSWTSTPTSQGSSSAPINNGTWGGSTTGAWQYKVNGETLKNATAWISYTGADGKPYTGCFYFDKNGNMATGWQKVDNIWYFFDTTPGSTLGMMKTSGWITTDGKQYYVGADGKMLANTTTPDGHKVDATGARID